MAPNINDVIFDAMYAIAKEKGISLDIVLDSFKESIFKAAINVYKYPDSIDVVVNVDKREFKVLVTKDVVNEVEDDFYEVSVEVAKGYKPDAVVGDQVFVEVGIADFGRNAIHMTKQLIMQKIVEAERESIYKNYFARIGDVVTGSVQQVTKRDVLVTLGKADAILTISEKIRKEKYKPGDMIKGYIYDVKHDKRGAQIYLSRVRPEFLKKLLELEIPEVYNGVVQIKGVSRDPGNRAKIAVYTSDEKIDPVGACVGMKGSRIMSVVRELSNEQIDVIMWSPDFETYVRRTIGKNINVVKIAKIKDDRYLVVVDDEDLARAIGKEGQNIRLSSQLLGVEIDVVGETEYKQHQQQKLSSYYTTTSAGEVVDEEDISELPEIIQTALHNGDITKEELEKLDDDDLADRFDMSMDEIAIVRKYFA